jgi:putative membrane protein
MFAGSGLLWAQQTSIYDSWETFGMAILSVLIFGVMGMVLAFIGFKIFDQLTPGKLDEEILQKQNIAAAILAAAVILGSCIIVAAAVHG